MNSSDTTVIVLVVLVLVLVVLVLVLARGLVVLASTSTGLSTQVKIVAGVHFQVISARNTAEIVTIRIGFNSLSFIRSRGQHLFLQQRPQKAQELAAMHVSLSALPNGITYPGP